MKSKTNKDLCHRCGTEIKHNLEQGNFCQSCNSLFDAKVSWRKSRISRDHWEGALKEATAKGKATMGKGKYKRDYSIKQIECKILEIEKEMDRLYNTISNRWGICMYKDDWEFFKVESDYYLLLNNKTKK